MPSSLKNLKVVLASPIYSGNVGAVCRAMKNMGVTDLRIAAPRAAWKMDDVKMMALHAFDVFERRKEFPSLAEAVADCGLVAGTTARRGLYRDHANTPRGWAERLLTAAAKSKVALVFGPEDSGLSNEDIQFCTQIIRIPTSPKYSSLNLAQAVLVCCYDLYVASGQFEPPQELSPEAPAAMREQMFEKWRESLLDIGFMKGDKADHMMLGLRRILSRGLLTVKDVRIMVGIARQMKWAAEHRKKDEKTEGGGHKL